MDQINQSRLKQHVWLVFVLCSCLTVPSFCSAAIQTDETIAEPPVDYRLKVAIEILASHDIEPTTAGIQASLQIWDPEHPSHLELLGQAEEQIRRLASPSYQVREGATLQLKRMAHLPVARLTKATNSSSREIAFRAREILDHFRSLDHSKSSIGILESACRVIVAKKLHGLADALLNATEQIPEASTVRLIQDAMLVTAKKSDEARLRKAMSSQNYAIRKIGALALLELSGNEADDELKHFLKHENDDRVRISVARGFANRGERDSVGTLADLLTSNDIEVRVQANETLESLTRQTFGFVAYAKLEDRKTKIERWQKWIDENLEEAALQFPFKETEFNVHRILYSDYNATKIVELDMSGKEVWSKQVGGPWNVQGLPNGHRLVSTYSPATVVEFDASGKEVWKLQPEGATQLMGLHRISNGNTLIGLANNVVEYDRDGEKVWEFAFSARVGDCQRLKNGNTLVALYEGNKVVEIDTNGETIWSIPTDTYPMSVQRTARGTTLVSSLSSPNVREYSLDKKVVWEVKLNEANSVARRFANGDTLISGKTSITLLGPDKKERWRIEGLQHSFGASGY